MGFNYKILTFNFKKEDRLKSDLLKYYASNDSIDIVDVKDANDISEITKQYPHVTILANIDQREHIITIINSLSYHRKKKIKIYSIVFTRSKSKKLENVLNKNGCNEILKPETNYRTISFKIDNQIKKLTLSGAIKKDSYDTKNSKKNNSKKSPKAEVKHIDALNSEDDVWSSKSNNDHKKFLRRWLLRLKGPSLQAGKWIEIESKNSKNQYWQFSFEPGEKEKFCPSDGVWIFHGNKPEFDWKHSWWTFTSEKPAMFFLADNGEKKYRFFADKDNVFLRQNSEISAEKLALIEDSCNVQHKIESEKKAKNDDGTKIKSDSHLDKYLKGEDGLGADELKNLSGKSAYKEEDKDKNLKGKTTNSTEKETDKNHKLSNTEKTADGSNESNFKENSKPSHYKGKSKPEAQKETRNDGPNGDVEQKEVGAPERTNSSEYPIDKHYKGKTASTDDEKDDLEDKLIGQESSASAKKNKEKELEAEKERRAVEKSEVENKKRKAQKLAAQLDSKQKSHLEKDYQEPKSSAVKNKTTNREDENKLKNRNGLDAVSSQSKQAQLKSQENEETIKKKQAQKTMNNAKKPAVKDSELSQLTKGEKKPQIAKESEGQKKRQNDIESKSKSRQSDQAKEGSDLAKTQKKDNVVSLNPKNRAEKKPELAKQRVANKKAQNEVKERSDYGEDYYRIGVGSDKEVSTESGQVKVSVTHESKQAVTVKFNDFYPQELTVLSDEDTWSQNDDLSVNVELIYNKEIIALHFEAQVEEVEKLGDEYLYVLKLDSVSEQEYEKFIKLYSKRQDNIHSFMHQAKGA